MALAGPVGELSRYKKIHHIKDLRIYYGSIPKEKDIEEKFIYKYANELMQP